MCQYFTALADFEEADNVRVELYLSYDYIKWYKLMLNPFYQFQRKFQILIVIEIH
jgi:hypothetical protein